MYVLPPDNKLSHRKNSMITRSQKIRLGIFITAASVILFVILFALSYNQFIKKKDIYYIAYKNISVSGLNVGGSVKYLGINVGNIKDIRIDPEDINRIIVTVGIKAGTPIKKDVRADINTIGITGIKIIELRGGSNEAPLLEPGGFINPGRSLTEDITGKAEVIAEKVELVVNNLLELTAEDKREKIFALVDKSNTALEEVNGILSSNRQNINRSLANLDIITGELAGLTRSARVSLEEIETVVTSDSFRTAVNTLIKVVNDIEKSNLYNLISQLNELVTKANGILKYSENMLKENRYKFYESINDLNETIKHLNNAAKQIDEDPSVLIGGSKPSNPPDDKLE